MIEQLWNGLQPMWSWLLTQLGWQGIQLSWVHILFLALAFIGALIILRNLIGGRSGGGGGGSYAVGPPRESRGGLPTRFYVGGERLGDFSTSPEVYDFKVPSPIPDLSGLRGPVKMDLNRAKELFVPAGGQGPVSSTGESSAEEQPAPSPPVGSNPNWELASRLFIPKLRR